ncbi:MAG: Zn-ribbon domain-containing OB-fold protein [Acidimicrobiia bacterium]
MTVMENLGVRPAISPETRPFWDAAARGDLVVEFCTACGLHIFPPRGVCRRCHSRELDWVTVEPPGVLYSYTVNHNAWFPGADAVYTLALVEFPEYSGARFVGFLKGFEGEPTIGTQLDVSFQPAFGDLHRVLFSRWLPS